MLVRFADKYPSVDRPGVWIAPDAVLIGDVRLSDDVGVWFGSVMRGDNEPILIVHVPTCRNSVCSILIRDIRWRWVRSARSGMERCCTGAHWTPVRWWASARWC